MDEREVQQGKQEDSKGSRVAESPSNLWPRRDKHHPCTSTPPDASKTRSLRGRRRGVPGGPGPVVAVPEAWWLAPRLVVIFNFTLCDDFRMYGILSAKRARPPTQYNPRD